MAVSDYPAWAVVKAIRAGLDENAALEAYRRGGGDATPGIFRQLYGQITGMTGDEIAESTRPLNRKPTGEETWLWATPRATGVIQQITVYVMDNQTGTVIAKPYSVLGDDFVSRGKAIGEALAVFTANAGEDAYDETVLGAVHVGSYLLTPQ